MVPDEPGSLPGLEQPLDTALAEPDDAMPWTAENAPADTSLDDEIPF